MKNLSLDLLFILAFPLMLVVITFLIFAANWLYSVSETLGGFAGIILIFICAVLAAKTISFNYPEAG
jgi:hypothetical protein